MGLLAHIVAIALLTLLTQVGGALYFLALIGRSLVPGGETRLGFIALFLGIYVVAWFPIEKIAEAGGRAPLPCRESAETPLAASSIACAMHRHYVTPPLKHIAEELARATNEAHPGTLTRALDANAPFLDGYPLLPHLSHDDGRKMDLAFYYATAAQGDYRRGVLASPLGYWAFEKPRQGDPRPCQGLQSALRWDMDWFQPLVSKDYVMEPERTAFALRWLATRGARMGVERVFLEEHLQRRLGTRGGPVRFQGCGAARHDDHMHVQVR